MVLTNKVKRAVAVAGLLAGLAVAGNAFAQADAPTTPADKGSAVTGHEPQNGERGMMHDRMHQKTARTAEHCGHKTGIATPDDDGASNQKN